MRLEVKVVFFYLLLLFSSHGFSQNSTLDSLRREMKNSSGLKLSAQFLEFGEQMYYATGSGDTLKYYSKKALDLAKKGKSPKDQMFALKLHAVGNSVTAKYDESNQDLRKALTIAKKYNEVQVIADINNKFGYNYQLVGELDSALIVYIAAAENFDKLKAYDDLAIAYLNITTVFSALKREDEVKLYLKKMLDLEPKLTTIVNRIMVLALATSQYAELGEKSPELLSKAKKYGEKAIRLALQYGIHKKTGQIYSHLGKIASIEGQPKDCIGYNIKALEFRNFLQPGAMYNVYFLLADSYRIDGNRALAKSYLDSIAYLPITFEYPNFRMQYYELAYKFYKSNNDKLALIFHEKFTNVKDSLLDVDRTSAISELEQKFHRVESDLEIVGLNKEKSELNKNNQIKSLQIGILLVGIILLGVITLVIIYLARLRLKKKQQEIHDIEERLNRARMDPHFIFNVMSAIQSISYDESRKEEIPIYIARFSNLMRQSMESTFVESTTLENELEFITNYLELQKLIKGKKFNYEIIVDEEIDSYDHMIPGMIIQPFLENAIEHGFSALQREGHIELRIGMKNNATIIEIVDNGNGVDYIKEEKRYPSRATQIIKDRLQLIERKYNKTAALVLSKASLAEGFKVNLLIPEMKFD